MIGLFFEVEPREGHGDHYFNTAAALRPALEENGGIAFIDRFRSLRRREAILSCQHWQDEEHLLKWRANQKHYAAQRAGREIHFAHYRIRVAPEIEATALNEQERWIIAAHHDATQEVAQDSGEVFESVYRTGQFLTLFDDQCGETAASILDRCNTRVSTYQFAVARDYTMSGRAEAPQDW